jgi:hypothetical protein
MAEHSMAYVAFDTSKLHNAVALAEAGRAGEVRYLGEFENTLAATAKLVCKLAAKHGALSCCYEACPRAWPVGWPDRLRAVPADQTAWPRLHRGGAADPGAAPGIRASGVGGVASNRRAELEIIVAS